MSVFSRAYGTISRWRRAWYGRSPDRRRRLARPVISVGNLTVGGSGKTPLVESLARLLVRRGERPAILTRGYARRHAPEGVTVVSDGERVLEPVERAGDEPLMLARNLPGVPVLVCADRHLAGRLAESRFGCSVHLLDDGFQHLQLARDVDLLVVGRADLDDDVLPAGRLREELAAATAADALLVPGSATDAAAVGAELVCDTVFHVRMTIERVRCVDAADALFASPLRRAVAVAAIARPERFFAALRDAGWEVVKELAYRDHHWFSGADLDAMARAAAELDADAIVTTAKDAVRLDPARLHTRTRVPLAYLPIAMTIEPEPMFEEWLDGRLRAARAGRGVAA